MRKEFSFLYIFFALIFTSGLFAQNEMAKESLFIIHDFVVSQLNVSAGHQGLAVRAFKIIGRKFQQGVVTAPTLFHHNKSFS